MKDIRNDFAHKPGGEGKNTLTSSKYILADRMSKKISGSLILTLQKKKNLTE